MSELKTRNISFLLVTAAKPEREAVLEAMVPPEGEESLVKAIGKNTVYHVGLFGQYLAAHVFCENQGSIKEGAAILTVQEAVGEVRPKACVMIGIAYGADPGTQKIGDVLISEYVKPYDSIRVSTGPDGGIYEEDRNSVKSPGRTIKNQFVNFDFRERTYNIWSGTILSGEKLIDNQEYKTELLKRFREGGRSGNPIIGGEMEGVGLASALARNGNENWMIVKAICDWADGAKREGKKEKQRLAAANAVDFCKRLFETDMLTHINGVRTVRSKGGRTKGETVNPYVLFYYRNMRMLSFRRLAERTGIPEEELRRYESVRNGERKEEFCKTSRQNLKKLRNQLDCDEAISCGNEPEKMRIFYEKYKGKGRFYPVCNAKAVIFDFDGTITRTENNYSSWQLIWLYLGYSLNDCGRYYREFMNGELTHQEWCDKTAECFIRKGLNIKQMEEISGKITLVDGTIETVRRIKEKGAKAYICSGAMDVALECVLGRDIALFDGIACNKFTYDAAGKLKSIVGTKYDFEGKARYIEKIVEEERILPEDCLFVGNSDNDVLAYKSGAKTLVVNPHKISGMDSTVWKYYMEEMNHLEEILPYVFPEDY